MFNVTLLLYYTDKCQNVLDSIKYIFIYFTGAWGIR